MIIYKTTNLLNNKIYIGQDSNNNPEYFGSGLQLLRAIKKYGKKNFKKEILEECTSRNLLDEREVYWIKFYNSVDREIGYNITEGGNSAGLKKGYEISRKGLYNYWVEKYGKKQADMMWDAKKKKNSEANKKNGTVFNKRIYQHWIEKYGEEEANKRLKKKKEKLIEYNKKKKEEGWCHSEESKNKIAEANKNRVISDETRKKQSDLAKLVDRSYLMKPVLQFDLNDNLIQEWKSVSDAARFFSTRPNSIFRVIKGKRKQYKNFKWKYK